MEDIEKQLQNERMIEQMEEKARLNAENMRDIRRRKMEATAPLQKTGYLVAFVIGVILFWFVSTYVFGGNRVLTGALIVFMAIFGLLQLRGAIETKGARVLADTSPLTMS